MSEWITDREPHYRDDGYYVFNAYGKVTHWAQIQRGEAWMPIVSPEPYVKPKRWRVSRFGDEFTAYDSVQREHVTPFLPTREAAERIAAIYEEVMP
jgi:hypothetical protein